MLATDGLTERVTRLRSWNAAQRRDAISLFRFAVPRLKQAFALFSEPDPIDELHARGPNKTGKTLSKAAFVIACLQKRKHLDGVPIPQWKGRVEGIQLVLDYPQQLLSVKPAYEKLLEGWPHAVKKHGEYLHTIRIMPEGGNPDSERDWSVIHFLSQKNRDTGRGARADIVDFDEPPDMFFLRELRKAGHAGRRSIRVIGETPEHLREWAPIREDYGDTPRRTIRRVDEDRAEVRWSLDEIQSWVLSDEEKAKMRRSYANDPLKDAREHGDYTNAEGSTPWGERGILTLHKMLEMCTPPEIVTWRISREVMEKDDPVELVKVPIEVWKHQESGKTYYEDIDPASGVDDQKHHQAGLHLSEQGSGDLCVRWGGYLAPYSLGVLGAGLALQYNHGWIDIEMKDHWGVNVKRGCDASGYANLYHERRELTPGTWAKEVGFDMNEEVKAIVIGGIQEWLSVWAAWFDNGKQGPRPYAFCPSSAVITGIMNAELDERGKVVAGPGLDHGFDMILWGQKLRKAVSRSNRPMPDIGTPPETQESRLIAMIQGKHQEYRDPHLMPKARRRTRI